MARNLMRPLCAVHGHQRIVHRRAVGSPQGSAILMRRPASVATAARGSRGGASR